ncbi:VanZ family protein, partial [Gordonibacter pamelaeae]
PRSAPDGAPGHGPDRAIGGAADGLPGIAAPAAFRMERPAGFLGSRALTGCLFAVYLAFLAWIVLLKGQFSLEVAGTMRSVNLVPLAGATVINGAADYREAVENLLAFLPFGLYLGMLAGHRPLWRGVAVVAAVSLGFEVLQFAYAMGASDVTDLLANTVGGALGLGLYALARRAFRSDGRTLRWCNAVGLACTALVLALTALLVAANA